MNEIAAAILPVFLVAGAAYAVRRRNPVDARTLSTLNLYLLIPALVFSSVSHQTIPWDVFGRFAAGAILMVLTMTVLLGWIATRRGLTGPDRSAFMMTMFMNLGNFGLPVSKFAFGDEGLAFAVVAMVCGSFLQNSVGIYFAQRSRHGSRTAFLRVFQFPMVYAFALALICQRFGWHAPLPLERAISITGDACIPLQLILLGSQLAETSLDMSTNVFITSGIRLLGGPLVAAAIAWCIGFEGLPAKVFILQMSGPIAVGMGAYGVQFDIAPRFLASVVAWSFLLSLATVSFVLFVLKSLPF